MFELFRVVVDHVGEHGFNRLGEFVGLLMDVVQVAVVVRSFAYSEREFEFAIHLRQVIRRRQIGLLLLLS